MECFSSVRENDGRYTLTIGKPRGVLRFLNLVGPYVLDRYEEAELIVGELVPALQEGKHTGTKEEFIEVVGMLEDLRELNPRTTRSKYDQEYFREEWDL